MRETTLVWVSPVKEVGDQIVTIDTTKRRWGRGLITRTVQPYQLAAAASPFVPACFLAATTSTETNRALPFDDESDDICIGYRKCAGTRGEWQHTNGVGCSNTETCTHVSRTNESGKNRQLQTKTRADSAACIVCVCNRWHHTTVPMKVKWGFNRMLLLTAS